MAAFNGSILIAGVARNCANNVKPCVAKMLELGTLWEKSSLLVVTNDNSDGTPAALAASGLEARGGKILQLDGLAKRLKSRTERLAHVRNEILRHMWNMKPVPDCLIMMDMDGLNDSLPTGDNFVRAIASAPEGWAGLFPNQLPYYYDIYALRHAKWCNIDVVNAVDFGRNPILGWLRLPRIVGARQIRMPLHSQPIRVNSAFGGFGLYRTQSLRDCWYDGRRGDAEICEHVPFHEAASSKGGRFYIVPSLINLAPRAHIFRWFKKSRFQEAYDKGEYF